MADQHNPPDDAVLNLDEESDDLILAVYRHDPGDDEGNKRRSSEAIARMLGEVIRRHGKKPSTPPAIPPGSPAVSGFRTTPPMACRKTRPRGQQYPQRERGVRGV